MPSTRHARVHEGGTELSLASGSSSLHTCLLSRGRLRPGCSDDVIVERTSAYIYTRKLKVVVTSQYWRIAPSSWIFCMYYATPPVLAVRQSRGRWTGAQFKVNWLLVSDQTSSRSPLWRLDRRAMCASPLLSTGRLRRCHHRCCCCCCCCRCYRRCCCSLQRCRWWQE